jgi:hypothetical protein
MVDYRFREYLKKCERRIAHLGVGGISNGIHPCFLPWSNPGGCGISIGIHPCFLPWSNPGGAGLPTCPGGSTAFCEKAGWIFIIVGALTIKAIKIKPPISNFFICIFKRKL